MERLTEETHGFPKNVNNNNFAVAKFDQSEENGFYEVCLSFYFHQDELLVFIGISNIDNV